MTAKFTAEEAQDRRHLGTVPPPAEEAAARPQARAGAPGVMHVITGLYTGGAERMLSHLVLRERAAGSKLSVVSLLAGGRTFERLVSAGISVADLGMSRGRPSIAALFRLAALIRRERPDVIQSWMYHADLVATLALLLSGRRRQTRLCWGVRCSNMDVRRYGRGLDIVIDACSWISGVPDVVIANSNEGRVFHERLGYRPRRFIVIDNGTDTDLFRPRPEARAAWRRKLGIGEDAPVVASLGRLDPMKDYDTFLEALDLLPGVTAMAIGEGTESLPAREGLHRLGERSDVPELLAAADVMVSTSAFGEGFSNAIVEAMATGVPVVATNVGDARRIIGDTGFVVPTRSPLAVAQAVRTILEETPAQKVERAARVRRRVVDNFSLERAAEAFESVYRGLA